MHDIIVFCKSYRGDVERFAVLHRSMLRHNADQIPFYAVVPRDDLALFRDRFGSDVQFLVDDDVADLSTAGQNWIGQQLIKFNFYKTKITKNYFLVDSDFYFIKEFRKSDLIANPDVPYTVMLSKEFFLQGLLREDDPEFMGMLNEVLGLMGRAKKHLKRPGPDLYFMPGPIWSCRVLEHMEEHFLKPNNLDHFTLLRYCPFENNWYGEWALSTQCIPIIPIEPLFKEYIREKHVLEDKARGMTLEKLSRFYHGLSLSSKWNPMLEWVD